VNHPSQAVPVEIAVSPKVIVLAKHMGKPAKRPAPPPRHQGTSTPLKYGNLVHWAGLAISLLLGLISIGLTMYFRVADNAAKSSDEHTKLLVRDELDPALRDIDRRFEGIDKRLGDLASKVDDAEGQFKRLHSDFQGQQEKQNQVLAIDRVQNPNRILGVIRSEIQLARENKIQLPASNLVDYRYVLQALPSSAREYWTTVADIINYQSLLNQLSGEAPDPAKVSHVCSGLTSGRGGSNIIQGFPIERCVIDLDSTHNLLENLVIRDSVVRYHGGPVALRNVRFVNCSFVLELPEAPHSPARPELLRALLDSDQKQVTLSTHA